MDVHPVADLFPMLPDDELAELAADIKARGLDHPIVRDDQGRILDGRNRHAACELAGVEPTFETYKGDDPDGYALANNIHRRHLTTGARAIVVEQARRLLNGVSKSAISADADLDVNRLSNAAVVLDFAADEVPKVLAGGALSRAVEVARHRKREAERLAEKRQRLADHAPDLLQLVSEGRADLDEALDVLTGRERRAAEEQAEADKAAHEAGVKRQRDIDSARQQASTVVQQFAAMTQTLLVGHEHTDGDIVTKPMVAKLRDLVDLLEERL